MSVEAITASDRWKKAVDFHGHICPGLSIGYKAAEVALERLEESRAPDEEIVAILETNACSADAVQVLTGCTFGKGNLIHHDYGKQAFTFVSRRSGEGVRVALKHGVLQLSDRHRELIDRVRSEAATDEERDEFWEHHRQKSMELLEMPPDELFAVEPEHVDLPPKAVIEPSEPCDLCGEETMPSKLESVEGGRRLCSRCIAWEKTAGR